MLGLKQFCHAVTTIVGIELMHRIRKGQFRLRRSVLKVEMRPQSGMQSSAPEGGTAQQVRALLLPICTGTPAGEIT